MDEKKQAKIGLGIGTASILMIFVILMLVTFAILSLSSARADHELSSKTMKHAKEYYQAENEAEKKLAEIDKVLHSNQDKAVVMEKLSKIEGFQIGEIQSSINFREKINQKQYLDITVQIKWDNTKKYFTYEKKKWETVVSGDWTINEDLPVFQPGN